MKYLSSFLIILISVSMLFAIIGCASSSPSAPQVAPTQPTQTPSPITPSASQPPATIPQPTPTTPSTPQVEENLKVVVDGNIDDWSSSAFKISDPCGDVSDKAASKKGADLKTVWTFMEEEYLYVAIQLCDAFDPFRGRHGDPVHACPDQRRESRSQPYKGGRRSGAPGNGLCAPCHHGKGVQKGGENAPGRQ